MRGGKAKTRYFCDSKLGGKEASLEKAQGYRDAIIRDKGIARHGITKNNFRDGIPIVVWRKGDNGKWMYPAWRARLTVNGKEYMKLVSIGKHGYDEAHLIAQRWLGQKRKELAKA